MRLVFDAAATVAGISLNSMRLTGPDALKPLVDILHQFRVNSVGFCGDIQEMFPQIRICPEDQDAHRFLWSDGDTSKPIDTYIMEVMTLSAKCSPCSAQHVKNVNAREHSADHPEAASAIIDQHYVDDYVMSFATPGEAAKTTRSVINVHHRGGFHLPNFRSNCPEVLRGLESEKRDTYVDLQMDPAPEKILGMFGDTNTDEFPFKINLARIDPDVASLKIPLLSVRY